MPSFVLWGQDHLVVLGLIVFGIVVVTWQAPRLSERSQQRLRIVFAGGLLLNEISGWIWAAAHGYLRIPLQLCDLAALLTVWGLLSLRPWVCTLAYFWGLAGSTQALLTPDLALGFPDYWWIKFFITHGGTLLGVALLAATGHVRLSWKSVWQVWMVTNLYAAVVMTLNVLWGTNYGYLAHKPLRPSLLDYLGPWPWYILGMEAAALAYFVVCYMIIVLTTTNHGRGDGTTNWRLDHSGISDRK